MTYNPLVSIIIPNYNKGRLLQRAVDSVINQSYFNWECIIVDNYSTGFDKDYLLEINKNPKINVFYIKNNGIIASSRNFAIKKSHENSHVISFLDSDDSWNPDKLEKIIKYHKHYDITFHNLIPKPLTYLLTSPSYTNHRTNEINYEDLINNGNRLFCSSVSINKDLIYKLGLFDESINCIAWEDFDLWLRAAKIKSKFKYVNSFLGYSYIGINNTSNPRTTLRTSINFSEKYLIGTPINKLPKWNIYCQLSSLIKINKDIKLDFFLKQEFKELNSFYKLRLVMLFIKYKLFFNF